MKKTSTSVCDPIFVMMVGPPGVGKSTYFKNCIGEIIDGRLGGEISLVSSDYFIERLAAERGKTYSETFADAIGYATKMTHETFENAKKAKSHIVWDQTNLTPKKRRGILMQVPKEYRKVCVYWTIKNVENWKKQLVRPGKFIPESVLENMLANYVYPSYNEGWDLIVKETVS